jgi:alkylation response protein AidB-like acyl-CoA dehydrogenase
MGNSLVSNRDQQFVLFELLDYEKLAATELFADFSPEIVLMMQKEAEKFAVNEVFPTYHEGDKEGCKFANGKVTIPACFHDVYRKHVESGWLGAHRPVELGGQGMPMLLMTAYSEYFCAANFAFTMYPGLTNGAAALIQHFGTEEQQRRYMDNMYAGKWTGTMCLTEPGAGSDVGAIKTTAQRLPDGRFLITGTKIFISCGDHDLTENIVHPVLARIEGDPPGTRGISLFLVPKYRVNDDGSLGEFNDVVTGNIEHKMGIKASATCTLNFGESGNCIGELLGKEQEGLKIMFFMMNHARLEVGMQGLAHASAAYEHALQYAKERIQGAPIWEITNEDAKAVPIIQHPDIRRKLLSMKSMVEGLRALNLFTAYCMDRATVAENKEEKEKWNGFVELLTPVCKAYSSDRGFEVCSQAIDIYGGYGYCSEYPVEQFLRDCRIAPIYEGTNGIQALDLVGRKLGQRKGMNAINLFGDIGAAVAAAKSIPSLAGTAALLEEANNAVIDLTLHFKELGKGASFLLPILNATGYLKLFGDVIIGYFLLKSANIAQEKLTVIYREADALGSKAKMRALVHSNTEVAFYQGKVSSAVFFAIDTLSSVKARCAAIKLGDKTPIEIADESFGG